MPVDMHMYLDSGDTDVPAALTLTLSVTSNILPAVMQSVSPDEQNTDLETKLLLTD